jgi:deazaflavin-dependent oxidoreductase (nitroreductase family)
VSSSFQDFNTNLIKDLRANRGEATSGPFKGRSVLILTTTGAKSKEMRESPVVYTKDGGRIVIVASKGGAPSHPSWYHNLVQHPDVTVELKGEKFKARAKVMDGDEYERLYKQHADINSGVPRLPPKDLAQDPRRRPRANSVADPVKEGPAAEQPE